VTDSAVFAPDATFALLALFVGAAYTAEAAAGFGSIMIALTLGGQLYPVPELLPVLVPLSTMVATWIVVRNREHVDVSLLARRLLPGMGVGLALGFLVFSSVSTASLTTGLGVLVVAIAGAELWRTATGAHAKARPMGPLPFAGITVGAGFMQGAAAVGGPLLAFALGRLGLAKKSFRSTIAVVWIVLNSALIVSYVATGRLGLESVSSTLMLVPVVAAGVALGNWLHHRLDEAAFRKLVLVLLLGAGLALAL